MLTQINAVKQRNEALKARAERSAGIHEASPDENEGGPNLYSESSMKDNVAVSEMDVDSN